MMQFPTDPAELSFHWCVICQRVTWFGLFTLLFPWGEAEETYICTECQSEPAIGSERSEDADPAEDPAEDPGFITDDDFHYEPVCVQLVSQDEDWEGFRYRRSVVTEIFPDGRMDTREEVSQL